MKDLNCDMGEGESPARTRALLASVTSANIACGGHAGDARSMRACLRLCHSYGVHAGAHPGFFDREGFGRQSRPIRPDELTTLLFQQVGALNLAAKLESVRLRHIKLHGALYHVVENDPKLARAYGEFVREVDAHWKILAAPDGAVASVAKKLGLSVWREVFADRAYGNDGRLLSRAEPGALISDRSSVRSRMEKWLTDGTLTSVTGETLKIPGETVCVHGDGPAAPALARMLAQVLQVRAPQSAASSKRLI